MNEDFDRRSSSEKAAVAGIAILMLLIAVALIVFGVRNSENVTAKEMTRIREAVERMADKMAPTPRIASSPTVRVFPVIQEEVIEKPLLPVVTTPIVIDMRKSRQAP